VTLGYQGGECVTS